MRLIAALTDPDSIRTYLTGVGRPADPPVISPARPQRRPAAGASSAANPLLPAQITSTVLPKHPNAAVLPLPHLVPGTLKYLYSDAVVQRLGFCS